MVEPAGEPGFDPFTEPRGDPDLDPDTEAFLDPACDGGLEEGRDPLGEPPREPDLEPGCSVGPESDRPSLGSDVVWEVLVESVWGFLARLVLGCMSIRSSPVLYISSWAATKYFLCWFCTAKTQTRGYAKLKYKIPKYSLTVLIGLIEPLYLPQSNFHEEINLPIHCLQRTQIMMKIPLHPLNKDMCIGDI